MTFKNRRRFPFRRYQLSRPNCCAAASRMRIPRLCRLSDCWIPGPIVNAAQLVNNHPCVHRRSFQNVPRLRPSNRRYFRSIGHFASVRSIPTGGRATRTTDAVVSNFSYGDMHPIFGTVGLVECATFLRKSRRSTGRTGRSVRLQKSFVEAANVERPPLELVSSACAGSAGISRFGSGMRSTPPATWSGFSRGEIQPLCARTSHRPAHLCNSNLPHRLPRQNLGEPTPLKNRFQLVWFSVEAHTMLPSGRFLSSSKQRGPRKNRIESSPGDKLLSACAGHDGWCRSPSR